MAGLEPEKKRDVKKKEKERKKTFDQNMIKQNKKLH